jgi:hypothetical protein
VHHHQDKKYAKDDQQQAAQYEPEPEYYEEDPAPPPPTASGPDLTAQLQQLGELHASGVLDDEEFAAAKAKLLAG